MLDLRLTAVDLLAALVTLQSLLATILSYTSRLQIGTPAARPPPRARGMNFVMALVFGLLSRKIVRQAKKRGIAYSFLFVHPDGGQLVEIGELLKERRIRPVIDKVFPFERAKEALAYLDKGRAKGKVVVRLR